jgi:hypothetical protein
MYQEYIPSSLLDTLTTRGLSKLMGLVKIVIKWIVQCFGNNALACNTRFTSNMIKTIKMTVLEFEYVILDL